jgi:hypothetical protein
MEYVVGLGSGRCGTKSLAKLLSLQPGANVLHERKPPLWWEGDRDPLRHLRPPPHRHSPWGDFKLWGDVGFYYLSYVEMIWQEIPETRFICLKRDREETVISFERYLATTMLHWSKQGTSCWNRCYPTIDGPTRPDRIRKYWDLYYTEAERLSADPRFRIWPTQALNKPGGVIEMLDFVGVQKPEVEVGIWLHQSGNR